MQTARSKRSKGVGLESAAKVTKGDGEMGLFSWHTQDTNRSIACTHSTRETFRVVMKDNSGNAWVEENYDGYGVFGGKDFYELLAEMNGGGDRNKGIELAYGDAPFLSPNLAESDNWKWENRHPRECENQGFFYDDGED